MILMRSARRRAYAEKNVKIKALFKEKMYQPNEKLGNNHFLTIQSPSALFTGRKFDAIRSEAERLSRGIGIGYDNLKRKKSWRLSLGWTTKPDIHVVKALTPYLKCL